jgi:hypothetical protein
VEVRQELQKKYTTHAKEAESGEGSWRAGSTRGVVLVQSTSRARGKEERREGRDRVSLKGALWSEDERADVGYEAVRQFGRLVDSHAQVLQLLSLLRTWCVTHVYTR